MTRVVCAVALCAGVLAGCAARTGEQDAARAVARFFDATARGDGDAACALLVPRVREEFAGSDGQPCAESLPMDRLGAVASASVWSDWATVSTDTGAVFLTEFESGWLITAAGCQPNGEAPYHRMVGH